MDYRDWEGYGDGTPYERRPATSWAGADEPRSADNLPSTSWGQRSRSGRPLGGTDLTDTDFDDAYWTPPSSATPAPSSAARASTSAIPAQRGSGRHRDDSDVAESPVSSPVSSGPVSSGPVSSSGWRQSWPTRSCDRPTATGEWQRSPDTDQWERSDDTGEWVRAAHTGEWRNPQARGWSEAGDGGDWRRDPYPRDWRDDTGAREWRRAAHTGHFDRITDTGSCREHREEGEWARPEPSRRQRRTALGAEDSWQGSGDTFWSGTRLAGDDPRWVETPASAPRSPAVAYPTPPRTGRPAPPSTRQVYRPPVRRGRGKRFDEELLDFDPGGHVASLLYTALWYAVPVLFFALWTFTLDNTPPPPGCVTDVTGGGCQSERAQAIASIVGGAPQFGAAFLASLVVAIVLRWASGTWRAASVGLAAAVVGGGLSTVLFSALSGQPIG